MNPIDELNEIISRQVENGELPDEGLEKVSGGQGERYESEYRNSTTCPRGVTAATFPGFWHCFNAHTHICDYFDFDDCNFFCTLYHYTKPSDEVLESLK